MVSFLLPRNCNADDLDLCIEVDDAAIVEDEGKGKDMCELVGLACAVPGREEDDTTAGNRSSDGFVGTAAAEVVDGVVDVARVLRVAAVMGTIARKEEEELMFIGIGWKDCEEMDLCREERRVLFLLLLLLLQLLLLRLRLYLDERSCERSLL